MPARILIDATPMARGNETINMEATVDGFAAFMDTDKEGAHDAEHTLAVQSVLGAISSQMAGDYQSVVTLTVVPQVGGVEGIDGYYE